MAQRRGIFHHKHAKYQNINAMSAISTAQAIRAMIF